MHYRPNHQDTMDDTFDIHIWMISKLLGPLGEDASPLAHHVIAANHAKMFQWWNYHSFNALLKRLNDQQTIQFFEQSYTPSPSKMKSDQHFLFKLQEFKKFGSKLLGQIHNLKLEADNLRSLLCPHIPGGFQVEWMPIPCGFHMEFVWLRAQPFWCKFPYSFHMETPWNIFLESTTIPSIESIWIP